MEDVGRLDERVRKLQTHFGQASKDIDDILISSSKVTKRGQKIEALEFGEHGEETVEAPDAQPDKRAAQSKTGQLRLRVVEDDD
jgi:DNA recombination protein RmuC